MLRQSCLNALYRQHQCVSLRHSTHIMVTIPRSSQGLALRELYRDSADAVRVIRFHSNLLCIARFPFAFLHHCAYSYKLQHAISLLYPTVETPTQRTLSIYMKNVDNRFAQIAIGSDPNVYATFDLQLGVLGTSVNAASSIVPAGDGWYRCSMMITSATRVCFVFNLTTVSFASRAQGNTTSGAIFTCFPQMKLGPVATSYIPTSGTSVTRTADVIIFDVSISMFRLYGVRDFVGPMGRRGFLGAAGPPGL